MDVETTAINTPERALLILNSTILAVGNIGGPLLTRLYFLHDDKRIWFSSWLQTTGFPGILIPLLVSYTRRRRQPDPSSLKLFYITPRTLVSASAIGTLISLANYIYSSSFARLPVSTSSLIISSQLAFTVVFSFFLVRRRFTAYSVNVVVLLTLGVAVLGLHANDNRPEGEMTREYTEGFLMMVATTVLFGLVLPLIELAYKNAKQKVP